VPLISVAESLDTGSAAGHLVITIIGPRKRQCIRNSTGNISAWEWFWAGIRPRASDVTPVAGATDERAGTLRYLFSRTGRALPLFLKEVNDVAIAGIEARASTRTPPLGTGS
jgi:hypothetical protein